MVEVYVSIGSNIERGTNVREALRLLEEQFGPLVSSSVYETESVGFQGPNFYNLVVGFETDRSLADIARVLADIEIQRGRRRSGSGFDDRTLDLDVILYGETVDHESPHNVPRPDVLEYAFVLCPLAEIAPDRMHPECGKTYAELWAAFRDETQKLWVRNPLNEAM